MNRKLFSFLLTTTTLISINAYALNYELSYDKEGRMVKNGNTTFEYTYPEDGVMMMTGYDPSHNVVSIAKHIYDSEAKTITVQEYNSTNSYKNGTLSYLTTYYYDTPEKFEYAKDNSSKIGSFKYPNNEGPLGATKRYQPINSDSNPEGQGWLYYSYDNQNRLTGAYICHSQSCKTSAENGVYTDFYLRHTYEYGVDANGNQTMKRKYKRSYESSDRNLNNFTYLYDEAGNLVKVWDKGTLVGTYEWEDPNWKANMAAKKAAANHQTRRIYTVEEATEVVKGNKNTFSIRYQ